jgi:hypothetical protein
LPFTLCEFLLILEAQLKNDVFWDVTPCGSCKNRRFGGTYRLHHQGDNNRLKLRGMPVLRKDNSSMCHGTVTSAHRSRCQAEKLLVRRCWLSVTSCQLGAALISLRTIFFPPLHKRRVGTRWQTDTSLTFCAYTCADLQFCERATPPPSSTETP